MTRVGVVGLGGMGGRIATTLEAAGTSVVAFDVSQDSMERARGAELQVAQSVSDLAASCDVVVLSLPTPRDYRPWFIEEPCQPELVEELPAIAAGAGIPIALGERLVGRSEFLRVLRTGAVAVLQPDPGAA